MSQSWPAADIARMILDGFDDYREHFRQITDGARQRFEQAQQIDRFHRRFLGFGARDLAQRGRAWQTLLAHGAKKTRTPIVAFNPALQRPGDRATAGSFFGVRPITKIRFSSPRFTG